MWYNNILETIGHTPMVKLNKVVKDIPATVLAKVETFKPGNSIKDRMAVKMIEDAERAGALKPGGTIIEGTSGNTGMGLAIAAIVKGYKCVFTTTDKQSKEKMDALRAFGAEVIVCPTNVEPEDPRSYYSVAARLNKEIPNSFYPNQYDNLSNRQANYEQTGPELWEQTEGKWVGNSAGSAVCGVLQLKDKLKETDVVVVIFHDHGTRYLAKIFNDDWMRKMGYLDKKGMTAQDIVASRKNIELMTIDKNDTIANAFKLISENNFSQLPVTTGDRIIGSVFEN